MSDSNSDRVQQVFAEALQQPAADRAAFLAAACGNDTALRSQVEDLLGALEEAGEFMKEPTEGGGEPDIHATLAQVPTERAGDVIGRYKLLEQIGEGGFGSVWAAEQRKPVKRRVALKIIKLGMDTKQVIARFPSN